MCHGKLLFLFGREGALPKELLSQEYFCKTSARNTSSSIDSTTANEVFSLLHNPARVHLPVLEVRAAPLTEQPQRYHTRCSQREFSPPLWSAGNGTSPFVSWPSPDAAHPAQGSESLTTARINPWDREVAVLGRNSQLGEGVEEKRGSGAAAPHALRRYHSEDALWQTPTGTNMLQPQLEVLESSANGSPNLALYSPLYP